MKESSLNFLLHLFTFAVKPGVRYRELGNIIQKHAQANGFSVVRSYCGHGIHKLFHTAPNVPHYASEYSFPLCCSVDKKWFAVNAPDLELFIPIKIQSKTKEISVFPGYLKLGMVFLIMGFFILSKYVCSHKGRCWMLLLVFLNTESQQKQSGKIGGT